MPQSDPAAESVAQSGIADFPLEELSKHRGRWVAFSPDGRRLVGSAKTLAALDAQVRAAGENLEEVLLEMVPDAAYIVSGAELA